MILFDAKETLHGADTQRYRVLEHWEVISRPANDPSVMIHYLQGVVVSERGVPVEGVIRVTKTSPIAGTRKNVVTTATGSKYTLGTPKPEFIKRLADAGYVYDEELGLPLNFVNHWIDGDNWLTI